MSSNVIVLKENLCCSDAEYVQSSKFKSVQNKYSQNFTQEINGIILKINVIWRMHEYFIVRSHNNYILLLHIVSTQMTGAQNVTKPHRNWMSSMCS
jgi:hypothetical protein